MATRFLRFYVLRRTPLLLAGSAAVLSKLSLSRCEIPSMVPIIEPPKPTTVHYSFEQRAVLSSDLLPGHQRLRDCTNALVVPLHSVVRMVFTSDDVIHSWFVPALELKVDCIPGREQVVDLFFDKPGIYFGMCAELCGSMHARMPICIRVLHEPHMM